MRKTKDKSRRSEAESASWRKKDKRQKGKDKGERQKTIRQWADEGIDSSGFQVLGEDSLQNKRVLADFR